MKVSKHHYAVTLAEMGNDVYFLNPPDSHQEGFSVTPVQDGVRVVSYKPFFNLSIRFRFGFIYRILMRRQVAKLMAELNIEPDIVWCFDPNLYPDLAAFRAPVRIFHPVDVFRHKAAMRIARTAQILFSVSPSILDFFRPIGRPMYFINHGLGAVFAKLAGEEPVQGGGLQHICYVGNLLIPYLDRALVEKVIKAFPEKTFHFIGPYESAHSSLGDGDEEARKFIEVLRQCGNVVLHGAKGSAELVELMKEMDAFMLCYTGSKTGYDLSNSHKILEYLSTGKPIVSTPILAYQSAADLIYMPEGIDESEYDRFFVDVLRNRAMAESPDLARERKKLALQNTYQQQVTRIEEKLAAHKLL